MFKRVASSLCCIERFTPLQKINWTLNSINDQLLGNVNGVNVIGLALQGPSVPSIAVLHHNGPYNCTGNNASASDQPASKLCLFFHPTSKPSLTHLVPFQMKQNQLWPQQPQLCPFNPDHPQQELKTSCHFNPAICQGGGKLARNLERSLRSDCHAMLMWWKLKSVWLVFQQWRLAVLQKFW